MFGEIEGYPEGSTFATRDELRLAALHRHTVAGISGTASEGADAIVLAGGYEDDEDYGETIVYTGEGGNRGRRQVADQSFTKGNRALVVSQTRGLPVRVIRGQRHKSRYSPSAGYRYDGLFLVDEWWQQRGTSGYRVYRFRLQKQPRALSLSTPTPAPQPNGLQVPGRVSTTVSRVIRDTEVTQWVKSFYEYSCQVCNIRLEGPAGLYVEAAHIRPLGRPHNGPDVGSNVLCLCPNHHILFDLGAFAVADDCSLLGCQGRLTLRPGHKLDLECVRYHRRLSAFE